MPPVPADRGTFSDYTRVAGSEPIPGYQLLEPLGRGGFGEVWKCTAPGGIPKAVKFVGPADTGDASQFRQELAAFEQIKSIRHPFLLSLERVEVIGQDLVMVMELADHQLADRFKKCREEGLVGIPRDELLGYMVEAAEALDVISSQYGLQHLDVKPANLFLTAGHVKVGDYGLVSRLDATKESGSSRGLTPKYVAPEVLRGQVHTRSDQYSLALVYCELLTGVFPYFGRSPQQLMLAHVSSPPNLSSLPECDRPVVGRALAKKPEERFPSCLGFARALQASQHAVPQAPPGAPVVSQPTGGSTVVARETSRETRAGPPPGSKELVGRPPQPSSHSAPASHPDAGEITKDYALKTIPRPLTPGQSLPGLITAEARARATAPPPSPNTPLVPAPSAENDLPLAEVEQSRRAVVIASIRSVVPASLLRGESGPVATVAASEFVAGVLDAAVAGGHAPQLPGDFGRRADGTWVCKFPSTVPAQVLAIKLGVFRDVWGVAIEQVSPDQAVLRRSAPGGFWGALSGKKAGLEVTVQLPRAGRSLGEITVTGTVFGAPDRAFLQTSQDLIPKLMREVRRELGNVEDRRKHPRTEAAFPVTIYPLHSSGGTVDPPISGRCRDVSAGGLGFTTNDPLATKYAYVEFGEAAAVAGLAILVRVVRSVSPVGKQGPIYGAQFRTDL